METVDRPARSSTQSQLVESTRFAFWAGAGTLLPLLAWWLGWFPGFVGADSIAQLAEAGSAEFTTAYPPLHTWILWLADNTVGNPGAVTFLQVVALALALGLIARRLVALDVPRWASVGGVWLVALLPAVGATTVTLWHEVPFAIALVWTFAEMLALSRTGPDFGRDPRRVLRLGAALAVLWLLRPAAIVTVVLVGAALAWVYLRTWQRTVVLAVPLLAAVIVFQVFLYSALPVERAGGQLTVALVPTIAAAVHYHGDDLPASDRAFLETIAPLEVWSESYQCEDATSLLRDREFDLDRARREEGALRRVAVGAALRHPGTAIGQRLCAAEFLFVPRQAKGRFFYVPPYAVPQNELEVSRDPILRTAFNTTKAVFLRSEQPDRLWIWWRPAMSLWLAAGVYAILALRGRRRLLWPAVLLGAQVIEVVLTSPAPGFRYVFGVYLLSWLSVPLVTLAFGKSTVSLRQSEALEGKLMADT